MDLITKLRYHGFAHTPPLWLSTNVSQFKQIKLEIKPNDFDNSIVIKNQRLGKLVEEFVLYQLQQQDTVSLVCSNVQIQNKKQTIGEIDALYTEDNYIVHLEIVYKFYLYDKRESYNNSLEYWIGPNRKDSFLYKLEKLRLKQFPLLYNKFTKPYLEIFNLDINAIKQKLCFKAQLFLPYQNRQISITPLNPECIAGFYISFEEIVLFTDLEFYIPKKLDWLITAHHNVKWLPYIEVIETLENEIKNERSPLVWLKHKNNQLSKCFITFW